MYAENMPLQVLGVPFVPPRCGIWARRHHAEMAFMNEFWFAVVSPPSSPTSFLMLLPKAPTHLLIAEALFDLSGRLVGREAGGLDSKARLRRGLNSSFENGVDQKGAPSPSESFKTIVGRKHQGHAPLVWRGGLSARRSRPLARRPLVSSKALFWALPMR